MKVVERDFVVTALVPDDTKLDDCEVIIHKASVSYHGEPDGTQVTLEYDDGPGGKDEVGIEVLSTRFTTQDGGVELEAE